MIGAAIPLLPRAPDLTGCGRRKAPSSPDDDARRPHISHLPQVFLFDAIQSATTASRSSPFTSTRSTSLPMSSLLILKALTASAALGHFLAIPTQAAFQIGPSGLAQLYLPLA